MVSQLPSREKYNTPLRQAQRDLTRDRIKSSAKLLFFEKHYDATTMDEIAFSAGLRRSTLYLHYRDKSEILSDLIADYGPKARAVLATLPGPNPSMDQLLRWVKKVARFVAKELVPLSIIQELVHTENGIAKLDGLTNELLSGLGENNVLFRDAAREDADVKVRARGLMLLQELTYACEVYLSNQSDPRGKALLAITAEDFFVFLSSPNQGGTRKRAARSTSAE